MPNGIAASLCVLGSGSAGNCTVLLVARGSERTAWLIDAGFGPRRTRKLLGRVGVSPEEVRGVFVTHFDSDHFRPRAGDALPGATPFFVHARHAALADVVGIPRRLLTAIEGMVELGEGFRVEPALLSHDRHGVMSVVFSIGGARVGFATDVGRATARFTRFFSGVDVMAIESNYCPRMQAESDRPEFLKRRIMGGRGHLSNAEAAEALAAIRPRSHVVFLHLSRQCNHPDLVAEIHAGADYAFTIAEQFTPTRWVACRAAVQRSEQTLLFADAPG